MYPYSVRAQVYNVNLLGVLRVWFYANMVDLGGYVIILVETKEKKIKLYGKSPGPLRPSV